MTEAPDGQPAMMVVGYGSILTGYCIQAGHPVVLGMLFEPLGDAHCASNHDGDVLPFAERSARFERFTDRDLIAFVADYTEDFGDGKLYLDLFRTAGASVSPLTIRGAPHSLERDHAVREQLGTDASR